MPTPLEQAQRLLLEEAERRLADAEAAEKAAHTDAEGWREFIRRGQTIVPTSDSAVSSRETTSEPAPTSAAAPNADGRGQRLRLTESVAAEVIRGNQGRPVPSPDMLEAIMGRGIIVGGKDPASTLAARLSRSSTLEFERGRGWKLRDPAMQTEELAPDALSASGAQGDQSGHPPD